MEYDRKEFAEAFAGWSRQMESYCLPDWNDFPALELYMDQVIALLNRYLEVFGPNDSGDGAVTAAMINNYVKMKIVPAPIKKRYSRTHLACLVMVCTLKHTLSMEMIRKIVPMEADEDGVRIAYQAFVSNQRKTYDLLIEILERGGGIAGIANGESEVSDVILQMAISSNLTRMLTRMMLNLPENTDK